MIKMERAIRTKNDGEKFELDLIFGVGNLTNDIETRVVNTKNGEITVAGGYNQSIAFNYWEKGEKKTAYYQIEAWGKTAEALGKLGKKGLGLTVFGRPEERSYTNDEGKTFNNQVIVIEGFQLQPRGKQSNGQETKSGGIEGFSPSDDEDIPF